MDDVASSSWPALTIAPPTMSGTATAPAYIARTCCKAEQEQFDERGDLVNGMRGRFAVLIMSRTAMGMVYGRVISAAPLARDVGVSRGIYCPRARRTVGDHDWQTG